MSDQNIIIPGKNRSLILLGFLLPLYFLSFLFFSLFASVFSYGLFHSLFFASLISLFVLFAGKNQMIELRKGFSKNPEFELSPHELIIYDHRDYKNIPYREMLKARVYLGQRRKKWLGIHLKANSGIKSNLNREKRWYFSLSEESAKIVFLPLHYANTDPLKFAALINQYIAEASR